MKMTKIIQRISDIALTYAKNTVSAKGSPLCIGFQDVIRTTCTKKRRPITDLPWTRDAIASALPQ
jgi:hypothetical protein